MSLLISTAGWTVPAAIATPSPPAASPGAYSPGDTIGSVTDQLRALADQNEALTERYNGARIEVAHASQRLAEAIRTATTTGQQMQRAQRAVAALVSQQYRQPIFSHLAALLSSTSSSDFLARLDSLSLLTRDRAQVLSGYASARARADAAATAAARALSDATGRSATLAVQRASLQTRSTDYQRRLATLTAAQRAAVFNPSPAPFRSIPIPVSGTAGGGSSAAQTAVKAAMAQLGKPYVYATAGPFTFDCSGLTMFAWGAAGVSIPHQSGAQFNLGTPVPPDKLAPGDLVFFYSDLHHVGLYIGNGMMVHAPTEGDVVKVTPINAFGSDYMGARRLG